MDPSLEEDGNKYSRSKVFDSDINDSLSSCVGHITIYII